MSNIKLVEKNLKKRYARERRFQLYGKMAVLTGFIFLALLLIDIISKAMPAFQATEILLDIPLDHATLELEPAQKLDQDTLSALNYAGLIKTALRQAFPEVTNRSDKKLLYKLVSDGAEFTLRDHIISNPELIGKDSISLWIKADDDIDTLFKLETLTSRVKPEQVAFVEQLKQENRIATHFNTTFFSNSDSREPEQAGIKGALLGSFWTLLVTLLLSLPIGIGAAVYLEEFAPQNKLTDFVEININNLAAVPSIVFGLLGLAVFINFFGMPRSAPLVGGLVLSLMTLPTIIISSRAAIKAVPPSIKEAALGLGASHVQTVFHHVIPLAMPGILTGAIIGMAQALGETAPLLMIGMVAFIVDVPGGILDSATVLPVQIYLWADSPERAFTALTAATILVLLVFLATMNTLAILLRKHFEKRW
ncbi:MAG: phosphate ABC transporter permease PstA [Gammaproteobacteria bacterium]|nr:phosphate ABC transporter permease PstA [Gammaproteobacteria bacterium]MBL7000940.1 phosphate ABC transporter permease PstA [Gammaproteobacteria bacterium]